MSGRSAGCCITDDNLWRPTRRAEEHYTKDQLSTRRGAVHSIGWLCSTLLDRPRHCGVYFVTVRERNQVAATVHDVVRYHGAGRELAIVVPVYLKYRAPGRPE